MLSTYEGWWGRNSGIQKEYKWENSYTEGLPNKLMQAKSAASIASNPESVLRSSVYWG